MKKISVFKAALAFLLILSMLVSFAPNDSEAAKVSYLRDTKKIYVYKDYLNNVTHSEKYVGISKMKDWHYGYRMWEILDGDYKGEYGSVEKETNKGLYSFGDLYLPYPIKKGNKWEDKYTGAVSKIISTNKTIKTPAGTFKNVIAIEDEYSIYYYAPGTGLIRQDNGVKTKKKIFELIKLKKR